MLCMLTDVALNFGGLIWFVVFFFSRVNRPTVSWLLFLLPLAISLYYFVTSAAFLIF